MKAHRSRKAWRYAAVVLACLGALVVAGLGSGKVWSIGRAAQSEQASLGTTAALRLTPYGTASINRATTSYPAPSVRQAITNGPLRVSALNPRYFVDATGSAVLLTGSHTWSTLQDYGSQDPPPQFDYDAYLAFLRVNNHNFFRLWAWEQAKWTAELPGDFWNSPLAYQRTGPGLARDGKPKFDLTRFNQAYFDRLRQRVVAARDQGIYVSVMLFDGWSIEGKGLGKGNPWPGHPFHSDNNINGIDGDSDNNGEGTEVHTLQAAAITELQKQYVRKVIDTVNDLDNVLFEISNESGPGSEAWQYMLIDFIHTYEATKQKQHPVGMTVQYPNGSNAVLLASDADWISINGDINNLAPADGRKVLLTDSDHLCGICGEPHWIWQAFTRGHNPIFMDPYDAAGVARGVGPNSGRQPDDPVWVAIRKNMGYVLSYANRMNLNAMLPRGDLASSGFALANPASQGAEYLVYLPSGGAVTVNLSGTKGALAGEWLNPSTGARITGLTAAGGATRSFTPPFAGDAVLYLYQSQPAQPTATPTATPTPTLTPTAGRTPAPSAEKMFLPVVGEATPCCPLPVSHAPGPVGRGRSSR